jgi:hypothetical protein
LDAASLALQGECGPFKNAAKRESAYWAVAWTMRNRFLSSDPFFSDGNFTYNAIIKKAGQYDGYYQALREGYQPEDDGGVPRRIAEAVFSGRNADSDPTGGVFWFVGAGARIWNFDSEKIHKWDSQFTFMVEGESNIGNPFEGLYFSRLYYKDFPGWSGG